MARKDHMCPIMKKTCIGCSVYRGRHMGLWTNGESASGTSRASGVPSAVNGSGDEGSRWIASFDAFVKKVSGPDITFDRE